MIGDNTTAKLRIAYAALFAIAIVAGVAGWLVFKRSPAELAPVLMYAAAAIGVGEASNIGKRATFKAEAVEK